MRKIQPKMSLMKYGMSVLMAIGVACGGLLCVSQAIALDDAAPSVKSDEADPFALAPGILGGRPDLMTLRAVADELMKDGKSFDKAIELFRAIAFIDPQGELGQDALFSIAECRIGQSRYWDAYMTTEASFPAEFRPDAVKKRVALEAKIADHFFDIGEKESVRVPSGQSMTGFEAARKVYAAVLFNDPQDVAAPQAALRLAECHLALGQIEDAEKNARRLIYQYADSPQSWEGRAILAEILLKRKYERGKIPAQVFEEAAQLIRDCQMQDNPSAALSARIASGQTVLDGSKAQDMLDNALFYLGRIGEPRQRKAGIFLLKDLVKKYPDTTAGKDALARLQRMGEDGSSASEGGAGQ